MSSKDHFKRDSVYINRLGDTDPGNVFIWVCFKGTYFVK